MHHTRTSRTGDRPMRRTRTIGLVAITSLFLSGCYKSTPATADSATPSSTAGKSFDRDAARREILAADSAFARGMVARNVDSIMPYYDNDAVSLGAGSKPVTGVSALRSHYNEAVKANVRDLTFESSGVNFSDDGTMAWDYGTYSQTADVNGKPTKQSGNFLNVWKRESGRWKIVAEISN